MKAFSLRALARLFVQALRLCQRAGLVKLGHVAIDGTKIQNYEINDLWRHGVEAYLVHSLEEAQASMFEVIK